MRREDGEPGRVPCGIGITLPQKPNLAKTMFLAARKIGRRRGSSRCGRRGGDQRRTGIRALRVERSGVDPPSCGAPRGVWPFPCHRGLDAAGSSIRRLQRPACRARVDPSGADHGFGPGDRRPVPSVRVGLAPEREHHCGGGDPADHDPRAFPKTRLRLLRAQPMLLATTWGRLVLNVASTRSVSARVRAWSWLWHAVRPPWK